MKNIAIAKSPKESALQAIDAFLTNPRRLKGYNLKHWLMNMFGGPERCLETYYDHRDALRMLLDFIETNKEYFPMRYGVIHGFLTNAVIFSECLIEDEYVSAELTRAVITDGDDDPSDEYLDNLARQFELRNQLANLQADERDRLRRAEEKKVA